MSDVIIIGSGPAGISASLYACRAGLAVDVISGGIGSLSKAEKIENYYGFEEAVSGEELYNAGLHGARRLGVNFVLEEVVGLSFERDFSVLTAAGGYSADAVIIATGSQRAAPKIDGLTVFEGRGVSYCAVCDAFFYRNKSVAVLGDGEFALHELEELRAVAKNVTLLTNGEAVFKEPPPGVSVISKKISSLAGEGRLEKVVFDDGSSLDTDGLFIAYGVAGSSALARMIGAVTKGNNIATDENMSTNIPGLFAAGDCTGGLLQISKAVYEGAKAATEAVKFIRSKRK